MAKGSKIFRPNGSGPFQITVRKIVIFCVVLLLLYFLVYLGPDMSRGPEAISPSPENGKDGWTSQLSTEDGPVPWEGGGVSKLSSYVLPKVKSEEFPECEEDKTDWVPCHDEKFNSAHKIKRNGYEFRERHCPSDEEMPKCLVPPPSGYKIPVKWPRSREAVWLSNVPHTKLADYKADQKWMEVEGDKVLFPGGGTFSKGGVEAYIEQLIPMLRKDEEHKTFTEIGIRMALDIGAGVASFGGHLLERNVVAASFAPLDVHDAQVQFALERGIPAYVAALASKRMPYPGGAFEMVHCSWCRIEWWAKDGAPLVEVDRVLRPGGYFVWTSPAADRDDETDKKWREQMNELIDRVCWKQIQREHLTVVWQKPAKDECLKGLGKDAKPPVCGTKPVVEELGLLWDKTFDGCIDKYRKEVTPVAELPKWPARLSELPPRLAAMGVSKKDFEADSATWRKRVETYWEWAGFSQNAIRNVMDMNAHWGSFAAALVDKPLWVYNVVPAAPSISSDPPPNTLPGLFDRGLLGMAHNWCQSFSTYPRTYDLLHAPGILSLIKDQGCSTEGVLLEMDRILRPTGYVILTDKPNVIKKASEILGALRWELVKSVLVKRKGDQEAILFFRKKFWLPGGNMGELSSSESDAESEKEPEKEVEKDKAEEEGEKVAEPEKEDGEGKGDGEGETEDSSKSEREASDQKEGEEETASSESKAQ
eukprot:TRINITY_DN3503_c0_g3_i1.p1 TRINITY_DN3503_c0_g3~~TRINITY_DN3503_c0_g3_i1.p1  ORF type:complete len:705 (+),score=194.15 TRINITY_DN3503_c0_g3_i1:32-2146(+)